MKTNTLASVATFVFLFLINSSFTLVAQELEQWTWDDYYIKFKAPSDLELSQNDSEGFSGSNSKISLSIYPMTDNEMSYSELKTALLEWVIDNDMTNRTDPEYLSDLNGYWGCYTEGNSSGFPVFAMLIVDPDFPDITHYVWISYSADYEETAAEILLSFTPI